MANVFPNSNLASSSQPWGREVQKRVEILESQFSLQKINTSTVDAQLQASYRRLDETVKGLLQADLNIQAALAQSNIAIVDAAAAADDAAAAAEDAQNAIDGLTGLGSSGSTYSINAGNISGGTITGVTLQTASSGQRITLGGTTLDFYSPNGSFSGRMSQDGGDAAKSIRIYSEDTNNYFQISNDAAFMRGSGSTIAVFSGQIFLVSDLVNTSGPFTSAGTFRANSDVFMPSIGTAVTNTANMRRNQGGSGEVVVTNQSSIRFKKDVTDIALINDLDPKKLLQLPARAFKYKDDYPISPDDSRYQKFIPGFIAEEVEQFYPMGADYEDIKNGVVESWNERMIVPGMLALIQELYTRIETLENGATNEQ
jgi:hypothetical protein